MSMNPEVKAKWVAALRSGEYTQGPEVLQGGDGTFCCLGVLCDLYAKQHGVAFDKALYGNCGDDELPSESVLSWASMGEENPEVGIGGRIAPLSDHNDNGGTFAEIANAIEEQL